MSVTPFYFQQPRKLNVTHRLYHYILIFNQKLNLNKAKKSLTQKNEILTCIYESVNLLGFWFEIKAYEKNNHRHTIDIPRIIFFA